MRFEALNENLEKITSELEEVNEKLKEIVNIIPMETNDYIFLEISKNLKKISEIYQSMDGDMKREFETLNRNLRDIVRLFKEVCSGRKEV